MTYSQAIGYIDGTSARGSKLGLERITKLLELIGSPQEKLRIIHIAGTNGKGSVCAMLESVLREAGYKTGLFVSPHILCFEETIRLNGLNISKDMLASITEYIKKVADNMEDLPTQFEIVTAIAFEAFKRAECDIVIIETGMGGRLDATNTVSKPLLSIITDVAMDHTAFLGDTIEKIAFEKAGIIKNNCPVLFGGQDEIIKEIIRQKAITLNSQLSFIDRKELKKLRSELEGSSFDFKEFKDIKISLLGLYQPINACVVLSAIEILREYGLEISDNAVYKGMIKAEWAGRFEMLARNPLIIFDGSHNSEGIEIFVKSIKEYLRDKKVNIIMGVMADKEYNVMVKLVSDVTLKAFTITPNNPRALKSSVLANEFIAQNIQAIPFDNINKAVSSAYSDSFKNGVPLVAIGSLYMYADIRKAFDSLL